MGCTKRCRIIGRFPVSSLRELVEYQFRQLNIPLKKAYTALCQWRRESLCCGVFVDVPHLTLPMRKAPRFPLF